MAEQEDSQEFESYEVDRLGRVEIGTVVEHPSQGISVVEKIFKNKEGEIRLKVKYPDSNIRVLDPRSSHLSVVKEPESSSTSRFLDMIFNLW